MNFETLHSLAEARKREQEGRRALVKGDEVCVIGRGTAAMVHRHNVVERVTKTMVVTITRNGVERFAIEDGGSKPYEPYSGTDMHLECRHGRPLKRSSDE